MKELFTQQDPQTLRETRGRYLATVEGVGYSWGWMGRLDGVLLLREITAADGRIVLDHTKLRIGKNLMQVLPLAEGDVIAFDASLVARLEDQYPYLKTQLTLCRPTKLGIVHRQAT
jgi:hypothetical protein